MDKLDLQNLPQDPAQVAMRQKSYLLDEQESEEDGYQMEALRRLKVRQLSKGQRDQTQD